MCWRRSCLLVHLIKPGFLSHRRCQDLDVDALWLLDDYDDSKSVECTARVYETQPMFLGAWILRAIPRWEESWSHLASVQPSGRGMKLEPKTSSKRWFHINNRLNNRLNIFHSCPPKRMVLVQRQGLGFLFIWHNKWPDRYQCHYPSGSFYSSLPARFWRAHLRSRFRIAMMSLSRLGDPL